MVKTEGWRHQWSKPGGAVYFPGCSAPTMLTIYDVRSIVMPRGKEVAPKISYPLALKEGPKLVASFANLPLRSFRMANTTFGLPRHVVEAPCVGWCMASLRLDNTVPSLDTRPSQRLV